jgi:uncharacterized protein (TIGR01777 family)
MKVAITGSSGLVGTALTKSLLHDGHTVVRLVRSGSAAKKEIDQPRGPKKNPPSDATASNGRILQVSWNPTTCDLEGDPFGDDREKIEGSDAIVNLAGAPIAKESWSKERKALLRSSRVHITRELICALEKLEDGPKTLLSASAIGYYGNRGDEVLTEESKPGDDFLARVAHEWEAEALKAEVLGMRVLRLRFGIILDKDGGALPQMMRTFRFGIGGKLGSGQQWMSWITLRDVVSAIRSLLDDSTMTGAVNVVAPQPVRNGDFAKALGQIMQRPTIMPAPAFALRFALGEMADALLLSSQRVMPSHLEQMRYQFSDGDLTTALKNVLA